MGGTDVEDFADRFVAKAVALEVGPAPDELFHYTSSDALTNICKNKSLWLTHAYFMNDTREFLHGMSMFREALDGFKKTPWMSGAKTFFDRDLSSHAKKPFIFSMTKNPDQLSQWRGYGDEGRGVSVGFRTSRLPQKGQFLLRSVVYNPNYRNLL